MKGRGTDVNPKSRFETIVREDLPDDWDPGEDRRGVSTQFLYDTTKSILAKNESPDVGFTYDLNPYRGCEHGCSYCYARPSHEYLGFSAGLDFETKIVIKKEAAQLLESKFRSKNWIPETVMLSGNVDCYQPVERRLGITRQCLEVFLKYRNPVAVITKNALVLRDIDILSELSSLGLVSVCLSITTLDRTLARKMEPRTSSPEQRLNAVQELSKCGVPVSVNVAPVIPGLNDEEIPAILQESASHGALSARYILLRLPYGVKDLFKDWLHREIPEKAERVLNRVLDVRNGRLNDSSFTTRMKGSGEIASAIEQLFSASCRKYGLNSKRTPLATDKFIRPSGDPGQSEMAFLE